MSGIFQRLRCVLRFCGLLAVTTAVLTALIPSNVIAAPKKTTRSKVVPPVAIVVGFRHYQFFQEVNQRLAFSVESSAALAKALSKNRYSVTFVTNSASRQEPCVVELENAAETTVKTAENAAALKSLIDEWTVTHFEVAGQVPANGTSPSGMVAFCGHGERRGGRDFFLTPDDRSGVGGIDIEWLLTRDGGRLPLLHTFDMCRTEVEPFDAERPRDSIVRGLSNELAKQVRQAKSEEPIIVRSRDHRTTEAGLALFAIQPNMKVPDSKMSLTRRLAEGLDHTKSPLSFRAKEWTSKTNVAGSFATEPFGELPIITWFKYAAINAFDGSRLTQPPCLQLGYLDPSLIIASRSASRPFDRPTNAIDLLPSWRGFADAEMEGKATSDGAVFTLLPGTGATPWSVSFFGELGGFDPRGKAVLIELIADIPNPATTGKLKCLVLPGDNSRSLPSYAPAAVGSTLPDPIELYSGIPKLAKITLTNAPIGAQLTSVAIGANRALQAWPDGATVTVRRLALIDASDNPGQVALPTSDLMPLWYVGNCLPLDRRLDTDAKLSFDPKSKKLSTVVDVKNASKGIQVGIGAPIFPPAFVPRNGTVLEIEFSDLQTSATIDDASCQVVVRLESADGVIAIAEFQLDKKSYRKPRFIEIAESGVVDYLAITSDAAMIEIASLKVIPATANLSRRGLVISKPMLD